MSKPDKPSVTARAIPTLADLDRTIETADGLSPVRRRDLHSTIARVASLLGERPEHVPLDMQHIAARLRAVNAVAAGISVKTLSNIRSDFMAAVRASGLQPVVLARKSELMPEWERMLSAADAKRYRIGLARFGRYASAAGVHPTAVNDRVLEAFIADIRRGSLHQNPNVLHRHVAVIWNELAGHFPQFGLRSVTRPWFKLAPKRVAWETLTPTFRADVDAYLEWCAVTDPFAENARAKRLKPRTLKLRRNQIHAAVTALVEAGLPASSISGLAGPRP